jgi:hypothetical protein
MYYYSWALALLAKPIASPAQLAVTVLLACLAISLQANLPVLAIAYILALLAKKNCLRIAYPVLQASYLIRNRNLA